MRVAGPERESPSAATADSTGHPASPSRRDRGTWIWLVIAAAFGIYVWVSLLVFRNYLFGNDLAIFDQVVRHYAHLHAPIADVLAPGANALGEHFSPILASLAPMYWLWPDPRMLLVAQAALVAMSIWPVWDFSRRRIGARPALVVAVAYALCWEIQALIIFDVHEVAFAVPLIAVAVNALDQRQDRALLAACLGLLLVREDMGLFLVFVALVLAVRRRFALAAVLAVVGLAAFGLLTLLVVPAFAWDSSFHFWTFSSLGPDPKSALVTALRRPWEVVQTLVTPSLKLNTLAWLVVPTMFLSLASVYALLAVPFVAEQLLNSRQQLWGPKLHYWAVLAPIVMMAAVDTLGRAYTHVRRPDWLRRFWLSWISLAIVAGSLLAPSVYSFLFVLLPNVAFQGSASAVLDRAITMVPAGTCVEADNRALPHLSPGDRTFVLGGSEGRASWVLIDRSRPGDILRVDPQIYAATLIRFGWRVESKEGTLLVLRRPVAASDECGNS